MRSVLALARLFAFACSLLALFEDGEGTGSESKKKKTSRLSLDTKKESKSGKGLPASCCPEHSLFSLTGQIQLHRFASAEDLSVYRGGYEHIGEIGYWN